MDKGIVYFIWEGYPKHELDKSRETAELHGYKIHVELTKNKLHKFRKRVDMFDSSPFEVTLFIDTDTFILGNIDYGFEMADKWGLACCIAPAGMAYDTDDNQIKDIMHPDQPNYNCGVLFASKKAEPTFRRYSELLVEHERSAFNDQPYFAQAVQETINPYILPRNWNYRPHLRYDSGVLFGDIKILHKATHQIPNINVYPK